MDKIARIRQEIKRRRQAIGALNEYTAPEQMSKTCTIFQYSDSILSELLSFLDTLSEEPDKSLEEAAEEYTKKMLESWRFDSTGCRPPRESFIAGAEWQKSQMLKDAVEGEICGRVYDHINVRFADGVCKYLEPKNISHIPANVSKYNIGDKVCIIVLKAEED